MSKVITFSTTFPAYHRNAKRPTHFVEQILNELQIEYWNVEYLEALYNLNLEKIEDVNSRLTKEDIKYFWKERLDPTIKTEKSHTIRAGNRFKVGELFSPRIWSANPYDSPQIIFWNDTRIKKEWKFGSDSF